MTRNPTKFWWDDWTAFVAAAINIVILWVVCYVFTLELAVSKASALLFYTRVFTMSNSKFKYAVLSVHAMNVAWFLGTLPSVNFICSPIQKDPDHQSLCLWILASGFINVRPPMVFRPPTQLLLSAHPGQKFGCTHY
ncbi:hypothetical protein F5883DRAFT_516816 [Diaporthe sp. PMI_573]|nr:hypothetical protein F5883DRAFT_516816 [Diaporthaceae sp. PMI_573]